MANFIFFCTCSAANVHYINRKVIIICIYIFFWFFQRLAQNIRGSRPWSIYLYIYLSIHLSTYISLSSACCSERRGYEARGHVEDAWAGTLPGPDQGQGQGQCQGQGCDAQVHKVTLGCANTRSCLICLSRYHARSTNIWSLSMNFLSCTFSCLVCFFIQNIDKEIPNKTKKVFTCCISYKASLSGPSF